MSLIANISVIALLSIAVILDLRDYRVNNCIIVFGWVWSLILAILSGGIEEIMSWSASCILPVLILLPLFILRGLGGADVKLFSVIGCFWGMDKTLIVMMYSFFIGAVLALVKMIYKKNLINRLQYLANYFIGLLIYQNVAEYRNSCDSDDSLINFTIPMLMASLITVIM